MHLSSHAEQVFKECSLLCLDTVVSVHLILANIVIPILPGAYKECGSIPKACFLCRSLIEAMGEGEEAVDLGGRKVPIRQYASWFNFKGGDQQKTVGNLSGLVSLCIAIFSFAAAACHGLSNEGPI